MNKKLKALIVVIGAGIGGVLYRLGGSSAGTLWRDIGVSAVSCLLLAILGVVQGFWQWLSLIPMFGLMWGALSTYRYFLKKPENYKWYHYTMHGFFVAFAALPYAWASGHWFWFVIRCIICAAGVGAWSHFIKHDITEEVGRGVIITATTALLLI